MPKLSFEIQYFDGCPHAQDALSTGRQIAKKYSQEIDYKETKVENIQQADTCHFLGSPTFLINGEDFAGVPLPQKGNFSCRFYPSGLPDPEQIEFLIIQKLKSIEKNSDGEI